MAATHTSCLMIAYRRLHHGTPSRTPSSGTRIQDEHLLTLHRKPIPSEPLSQDKKTRRRARVLRTGEVSSATQQLCPSNVEPKTMASRSFNKFQDALAMFPDALRYRSSTSSQVFSGLPGRRKLTASLLRPSCDKLAAKPERALIIAVVHSFEALPWMRSAHVQKALQNDTFWSLG